MEQRLLPLFPLQVVVFPRTLLPLHIFEERYKDLIGDVLDAKLEFGVVLAAEKGITSVGCTATVQKVLERYDDGRLDLLNFGQRRFEIQSLDDDKSYLRAEVEYFDDDDFSPVPAVLRERALEAYRLVRETDEPPFDPDLSDPQVSFQLAQIVPDVGFRQLILSTRSEAGRLKELVEYFPVYASRQRDIQHIREVAPKNGHGKRSPLV